MPRVVAMMEVEIAIIKLLYTDCIIASISGNRVNHLKVKPLRGNAIVVESLNANIGKRNIGKYKKIK
tara:strand:- start:605 stop:805 length:201 start_codon:yes stop_codon:yes gene_type:complete